MKDLARKILYPFDALYAAAVTARNYAYDHELLNSEHLPAPVLSVGNISVGGSGKTPFTMYLIGKLLESGRKPAVLSRGYMRLTEDLAISCPAQGFMADVRSLGDEPALISQSFPAVPVAVNRDRFKAGMEVIEKCGADIFILDDGFQNRELARDADFVLMRDSLADLTDQYLPSGNLRDSKKRLGQAQIIVLTSHERFGLHETDFGILRKFSDAAVAGVSFLLSHFADVAGSVYSTDQLREREVVAFCGIAGPDAFFDGVRRLNLNVTGVKAFRDHHWYDEYDLDEIFGGNDESIAVTTSKDAVRIFLDGELNGHDDVKRIYALQEKAVVNFGSEHIDAALSTALGAVYV
ncbi:MAG TPA: tetraacyldisaccharide 4'-kinase [Candidatus Kryptonia bacterium]